MKKIIYTLFFLPYLFYAQNNSETITISGKATDFNGISIDSCIIKLMYSDFSSAYEVYTDKKGNYSIPNVEKGKYMALYAIRPKEYPRRNAVPPKDMRLEFWAWNIIADRNLVINPKYERLELYGTHVFEISGGYPGLFIYFRPMSLGKNLTYSKDIYLNKSLSEKEANISVSAENLQVKIFADEEPLKINSIQPIEEFEGEEKTTTTGYIVQVDRPKIMPSKPYVVFRIEAYNKEFNERGENLYFYELKDYKSAK